MSRKLFAIVMLAAALVGCGGGQDTPARNFHTSGDRDADQRAAQRIAQSQQIKQADPGSAAPLSDVNQSLYLRLGGEQGITAIVDDFIPRVMNDPRVNWNRVGVKSGIMRHDQEQHPTGQDVQMLKTHLAEFISLATGGPAKYQGRGMKEAHAGMNITNAEFDASVGDLKVTMDNLHIANTEQRELLAIIESTRTQIVEER
jgi:hemoglobin